MAELDAVKAVKAGIDASQVLRKAGELHDAGKFAEAEIILREAISADPRNAVLWNARGVLMAAMRRDRRGLPSRLRAKQEAESFKTISKKPFEYAASGASRGAALGTNRRVSITSLKIEVVG